MMSFHDPGLPLLVALVALTAAPARAAEEGTAAPRPQNPRVKKVLELYERGEIELTEKALRSAQADERNTSADREQLFLIEGMLRVVSAADDQARAAFGRALELNPQAQLPAAASARARKLFEQARQDHEARRAAAKPPPPPTPSVPEVKKPAELTAAPPSPSLLPRDPTPAPSPPAASSGLFVVPGKVRSRAWIPAVAGGAVAAASGFMFYQATAAHEELVNGQQQLGATQGREIANRGAAFQTAGVIGAALASVLGGAAIYLAVSREAPAR